MKKIVTLTLAAMCLGGGFAAAQEPPKVDKKRKPEVLLHAHRVQKRINLKQRKHLKWELEARAKRQAAKAAQGKKKKDN